MLCFCIPVFGEVVQGGVGTLHGGRRDSMVNFCLAVFPKNLIGIGRKVLQFLYQDPDFLGLSQFVFHFKSLPFS
jgi:hypothetical protein